MRWAMGRYGRILTRLSEERIFIAGASRYSALAQASLPHLRANLLAQVALRLVWQLRSLLRSLACSLRSNLQRPSSPSLSRFGETHALWLSVHNCFVRCTIRSVFACAMFAQLFADLGHNNFENEVRIHNLVIIDYATNTTSAASWQPVRLCSALVTCC